MSTKKKKTRVKEYKIFVEKENGSLYPVYLGKDQTGIDFQFLFSKLIRTKALVKIENKIALELGKAVLKEFVSGILEEKRGAFISFFE